MTDLHTGRGAPVGVCDACIHHRAVSNRRGSRFHLCELSRRDARYAKYPPLPVLECEGFERHVETTPGERRDTGPR